MFQQFSHNTQIILQNNVTIPTYLINLSRFLKYISAFW